MAEAATEEPFRLEPEATEKWRSGVDSSSNIAELSGRRADASSDITALTGTDDRDLVSSLTKLQREKVGSDIRLSKESDAQQERDRAVRNHAFQLEGVAASEVPKPWDANKEHKKWETDPIEGFGSMGGLFAMVASAFTHAPMENAINGLAGAINSTKEGNEAGYQRAYDAFKENVKLADQRFKMQHELYSDALSLGTADAAASDAKMRNAAVRFGDQQMLLLAEHGMIKEIWELQASRAQAHEQMIKSADAIDLYTVQKAAVNAIKANPPSTGDPVQDKMMLAAQIQRIYDAGGKYGTAEQEAVGRFMQANMNKSPQEIADGLAKIHQQFDTRNKTVTTTHRDFWHHVDDRMEAGEDPQKAFNAAIMEISDTVDASPAAGGTSTTVTSGPASMARLLAQEVNQRTADYEKENIARGMPADEAHRAAFTKAMQEVRATQTKPEGHLSKGKAEQQEIDTRTTIYESENTNKGMDRVQAHIEAYNRAVHEVAAVKVVPSGNRADDLQGKVDQVDNIIHGSEKQLDFLHNFKGGAGLMGKIMRGEEIASNIVGAGTQSERVEFRRRVHELQEMVPRIITDASGRPLKAEQEKVDDFVAGLNAGDTGPNTIRAYEELIAEMQKRQADYRARRKGGFSPDAASSGSASPATASQEKNPANAPWLKDPVKQ